MAVKVMSESEFESVSMGDKVTFYKKPIEYTSSFRNLTELKEYTVIDKYSRLVIDNLQGPVLETLTILCDDSSPRRLHRSFFLSRDSSVR